MAVTATIIIITTITIAIFNLEAIGYKIAYDSYPAN